MTIARLGAFALVAALAAPALATAQGYGAPPPPPPAGQGAAPWSHGEGHHGDRRQGMQAHEQKRLQALREILRIRPDQDGAFQAYAAALRPEPDAGGWRGGEPGGDRAQMAQLTTPERLDRMAKMMDEHENRRRAAFERRASATKALYAALSPDQRRVMDALPELEGHDGHGWGKGGEMGPGPHGGMAPPPPPQGD